MPVMTSLRTPLLGREVIGRFPTSRLNVVWLSPTVNGIGHLKVVNAAGPGDAAGSPGGAFGTEILLRAAGARQPQAAKEARGRIPRACNAAIARNLRTANRASFGVDRGLSRQSSAAVVR